MASLNNLLKRGKVQIVIAHLEEDARCIDPRRGDLGESPIMERFLKPVACMWLRRGTGADIDKANAYVRTLASDAIGQGIGNQRWSVLVYPTSERDPLGKAKAEIMTAA
jgi:hypothetical protein